MAHLDVTLDDVIGAADTLQNDKQQVTIEAVRALIGAGSTKTIHQHLATWRASHAKPVEAPKAEMPPELLAELSRWAQQYAQDAGAGMRDALSRAESDMDALLAAGNELEAERDGLNAELGDARIAREQAQLISDERNEEIERLTAELRNARQIAADALVGKAKDQLAIDGKDAQLADLRQQLERNVAATAAESDERLRAQMELVGVTTERDNLVAEVKELRTMLDNSRNERSNLRAELETLRARK
ncbi:DNA-binding protein [Massilia sp. UYP11]|uniref:DNA-binding protein n=1 Tax=Massilia sp. UYP11 TaxID=1756385 RepID=UPI003D1AE1A4